MDELYKELEEITAQLINRINIVTYIEVEEFVDHRGNIIEQILQAKPVDSLMEQRNKAAIARLQQFDTIIVDKITALRSEASQQLMQLKNAAAQRSAYDVEQVPDSYFFDRKK